MKDNIYNTIDALLLALQGLNEVRELQSVDNGRLLLQNGLTEVTVDGKRYTLTFRAKGRHQVVPTIELEFDRNVTFEAERRSNGELCFTKIKGLKVTTRIPPIDLASTDLKQVTYKPHSGGISGIAARVGRFGIPVQFKLNAKWGFAGLGS